MLEIWWRQTYGPDTRCDELLGPPTQGVTAGHSLREPGFNIGLLGEVAEWTGEKHA